MSAMLQDKGLRATSMRVDPLSTNEREIQQIPVRMNCKSMVLSFLFFVNLLIMPFKPYLSESTPYQDISNPLLTVDAINKINETKIIAYFTNLYNHQTLDASASYIYDNNVATDISRLVLPRVISDCSAEVLTQIPGSLYIPWAMIDEVTLHLCVNQSIDYARVWKHTMLATPHAISLMWILPGNNMLNYDDKSVYSVYFLYVAADYSYTWRMMKFFCRSMVCLYIGVICGTEYYRHVLHLRNNLTKFSVSERQSIVRYELIIGDPTSIILSHPKICLLFILDFWMSPELAGQAAQRVMQFDNLYYFVLGSIYFSRSVWLSYGTLVVLNPLLKHFHKSHWLKPANPTLLAIAAYAYAGFFTHLQLTWYPMLSVYMYLFSYIFEEHGSHELSIEAFVGVFIFCLTLCTLPIALGLPGFASRATKRAIRSARKVSSAKDAYQWYPFPEFRRHCTIDQRGGDCYILGYNQQDTLQEITRVNLIYQLDLPSSIPIPVHPVFGKRKKKTSTSRQFRYAVGTLTLNRNSPEAIVSITHGPLVLVATNSLRSMTMDVMVPELYEKLFPEDYVARCMDNGVRPDGRTLLAGRPVSINYTAGGGCLVKLGHSSVLATVQFAVGTPAIATPDQGELDLQVLLTGVCASKFSTQRTTDEAQSLSSFLSRTLIGTRCIDLQDLGIETGKCAWKLIITVLFLDHDGNALDTAFIATMMLLKNLKFPAITVSSDYIVSLTDGKEEGRKLPVHQTIFPTTFGLFKNHLILDPSAQEEEFCGLYKPGGAMISGETLMQCMKLARARTLDIGALMG
ncbi:exosome complex exonuclease RRP43 [Thraustotheca clavata]|uniref:Ribosomal RNA-processing protein 43 n=1 Tax=Thraustotheca clavata TaxID=74557 RepID=A0A1V9Y7M7_9STRA|nr:exosome complex exonuclease RRP43 [Thraustotheca clavata]